MQTKSWNKEIKIATAQLIDALNDVEVVRADSNGNIIKSFKVPIKYGQRSRIIRQLESKNNVIPLPILAVSINSLERDDTRNHSINDSVLFQSDVTNSHDIKENTAIPLNITYNLEAIAKYQDDLDQIISNFVVNMNPSIYVVWPHPYGEGQIQSKVTWDGSLEIDYPEELDSEEKERLSTSFNLTYHTWIFPGTGEKTEKPLIKYVNYRMEPVGYSSKSSESSISSLSSSSSNSSSSSLSSKSSSSLSSSSSNSSSSSKSSSSS